MEMSRDYYVYDIPFLLWSQRRPKDDPLEANWEDPEEEWQEVNGWSVVPGPGDLAGDTQWRKGSHMVEVIHADLIARSRTYYASKSRAALETWKRDHKLKGLILVDERVVHEG